MKTVTIAMVVAVSLVPCFAFADCDPELLNALQTKYSKFQNQTLAETVFQLTCNKAASDKGTTLDVAYESFGLGFGQSDTSTAEACMKNDTSYFLNNRQQIGLSFIPDKAIEACFGGLSFTATQTPDGGVVTVAAAYSSKGSGILPKVKFLKWQPEPAMSCKFDWTGQKIRPGGNNSSCTRSQNVDVTFTLSTTEGDRSLVVRRNPVVEKKTMDWDYVVNKSSDSYTQCLNGFGELVGGWRLCDSDGTCNNGPAIVAKCRTLYGSEYLIIDGKRIKI